MRHAITRGEREKSCSHLLAEMILLLLHVPHYGFKFLLMTLLFSCLCQALLKLAQLGMYLLVRYLSIYNFAMCPVNLVKQNEFGE